MSNTFVSVDGITVVLSSAKAAAVIVDAVSDELKSHLRDRLAAFCYGAVEATEDGDFYSFEKTIQEFLERYDTKPTSTKIGMAGELVVHVFMPAFHADLSSSAVFFNKEERNIKKGFDLTFLRPMNDTIWYGEVKSGEVAGLATADEKARSLLRTAATDLNNKLGTGAQRSRWESALIDARLTLESGHAATARALLRSDASAIEVNRSLEKSVVLGATVMHDHSHCAISARNVADASNEISTDGRFLQTRVLVVQQGGIEEIVGFLREVANNA